MIEEFSRSGDDSAYLAWLYAHPDGYLINTEPGGRGYARLHRAICDTIRSRPPFTGPSYIKICSTSLEELDEWALPAERHGRAALQGISVLAAMMRFAARAIGLAMVFKLVESAQARWGAVNGAHLVPLVRAGARFERGQFVERPEAAAA
jgi:hypothetical protein